MSSKFAFLTFLLINIFGIWAQGSRLTVIGPCSETPLYQFESSNPAQTLGDFTVAVFQEHQVPFEGNRSGIHSIQNSPIGDEALEVLSDTQMRAYGWCVFVNGKRPDLMADEVPLKGPFNEILWIYAYTFYDRGVWKEMCAPSYLIASPFICQKK